MIILKIIIIMISLVAWPDHYASSCCLKSLIASCCLWYNQTTKVMFIVAWSSLFHVQFLTWISLLSAFQDLISFLFSVIITFWVPPTTSTFYSTWYKIIHLPKKNGIYQCCCYINAYITITIIAYITIGPAYMTNLFKPQSMQYILKNSGLNVEQPSYSGLFYHNSFTYRIAHIWNQLPTSLKSTTSLSEFRKQLTKIDLLSLKSSCLCQHCLA